MAKPTLSIQAGALRTAVMLAGEVTERRSTIPVLAHLYLVASGGRLTVLGTDVSSWISTSAACDGDLNPVTVSAARLSGLLALLPPEETVTLTQAPAGHLDLIAGGLRAKLYTLPAEDFPAMPSRSWTKRWTIPAGNLRNLFDRTLHAVSTEETRYYLNGVFLSCAGAGEERKLHATATDGHRMMVASEGLPQGDEPASLIVPRAAAQMLRCFLARLPADHAIRVNTDAGTLDFDAGRWRLIAKAIDGVYPDFWRVIPPEMTGEPLKVLDTRRFAEAVRTARAISDAKSLPIRIGNGEGQAVKIDAQGEMDEDCSLALPREIAEWGSNAAQPGASHGFQARYLLDVCGVFRKGFEIRVGSGEPSRITGPEGLAILMPMRM